MHEVARNVSAGSGGGSDTALRGTGWAVRVLAGDMKVTLVRKASLPNSAVGAAPVEAD